MRQGVATVITVDRPIELFGAQAARVVAAMRASWSAETSATPDRWSSERPELGQCEVSAFVAWEHFGGDLVLGQVFLDGVQSEHHHWNRIDGCDLDLTRSQFPTGVDIRAVEVLSSAEIALRRGRMRPDLAERIERYRRSVAERLS